MPQLPPLCWIFLVLALALLVLALCVRLRDPPHQDYRGQR